MRATCEGANWAHWPIAIRECGLTRGLQIAATKRDSAGDRRSRHKQLSSVLFVSFLFPLAPPMVGSLALRRSSTMISLRKPAVYDLDRCQRACHLSSAQTSDAMDERRRSNAERWPWWTVLVAPSTCAKTAQSNWLALAHFSQPVAQLWLA